MVSRSEAGCADRSAKCTTHCALLRCATRETTTERRISIQAAEVLVGAFLLASLACRIVPKADANRDGVVDPLDVALVASCLGAYPATAPGCATSDMDRDGDVDDADLAIVEARAGIVLPALVASDPAADAAAVPRTAWLRLDFAEAVPIHAVDTLGLRCAGAPQLVSRHVLAPTRVLLNPIHDLPANASCTLIWQSAHGAHSLAFGTAGEGAPATIYYDRTDPSTVAPFPDDYWLTPDPSTHTGQRVALPVLDREPDVVQLFTSLIQDTASLDGFSPLALITAELSAAPDPASLPMTVEASLDPLASVGLFDLTPGSETFGRRVPFQLHVRNDDLSGQPTAHSLVAFPSIPLTSGGCYGFVVTRRALADASRPFDPSPFLVSAMAAAAVGEDPAVASVRAVARYVLDGIAVSGVPIPANDVALALRITVRETSEIPRDLLAMKAQVLAAAAPAVTVMAAQPSGAMSGAWIVNGTWQAPSWRQGAFLARDANGLPRITRLNSVPFRLILPAAAMTARVPVVMYQHGNPGHVSEADDTAAHLVRAGFAIAGFTDPINRAYVDLSAQYTGIFGTLLFGGHVPDLWTQTYGEQFAFLRALESIAQRDFLPGSAPDGIPELDLSRPLGYMGLSNGGTHGQAFLAYAPEVRAAALVVGGSRFAELLFHQDSTDPLQVGSLLSFIAAQVPNVRAPDVWAGLSIFQMIFDGQDPQNHAAHLHRDPIEVAGTTRKPSLLVIEGIHDSFMPANAIRSLASTAGPLPQLSPIADAVPYLEQRSGIVQGNLGPDTTGAFVQYACVPSGEGHYCAQEASQSQQVAFLSSALATGAPVVTAADLDSDADGLSDIDELILGLDPQQSDSDGDGLADGIEVTAGLDPKDPSDAAADPDLDGLSNAEEVALGTNRNASDTDVDGLGDAVEVTLGTNPVRADTDGGARKDGQEVNIDHTDPLDRFDDVPIALLPMDFYDGAGFAWNFSTSGRISSNSLNSNHIFAVLVGGSTTLGGSATAPTEDGGRELQQGPAGTTLRLSRKIYFPIDAGFMRVLHRVENPGVDPVATTLRLTTVFTGQNPVVATSSGDVIATAVDDYVLQDPAQGPPIAHVLSGPGAAIELTSMSASTTFLQVHFPIVVPPESAVSVLTFALHRTDVGGAVAAAQQLVALGGGALTGISSAERQEIVNFPAPNAD